MGYPKALYWDPILKTLLSAFFCDRFVWYCGKNLSQPICQNYTSMMYNKITELVALGDCPQELFTVLLGFYLSQEILSIINFSTTTNPWDICSSFPGICWTLRRKIDLKEEKKGKSSRNKSNFRLPFKFTKKKGKNSNKVPHSREKKNRASVGLH